MFKKSMKFKKATGFGWYKGQFDINLYIYESIQAGKEFEVGGLEGMTCEEVIYKMLTDNIYTCYFEMIEKVELAKAKYEDKNEEFTAVEHDEAINEWYEEHIKDEDLDFELTEEEEADFGEEITEWYEERVAEAKSVEVDEDNTLEINASSSVEDIANFFDKKGKKGTLVF